MNQQQKKFAAAKAFSIISKKIKIQLMVDKQEREHILESRNFTVADVVKAFKAGALVLKAKLPKDDSVVGLHELFDLEKSLNLPKLPNGYREDRCKMVTLSSQVLKKGQNYGYFYLDSNISASIKLANKFEDFEESLMLGSEEETLQLLKDLEN
jgi:hypothetical protein